VAHERFWRLDKALEIQEKERQKQLSTEADGFNGSDYAGSNMGDAIGGCIAQSAQSLPGRGSLYYAGVGGSANGPWGCMPLPNQEIILVPADWSINLSGNGNKATRMSVPTDDTTRKTAIRAAIRALRGQLKAKPKET
jgi:hypothetical protein